jgi:hypothetical protein
MAELPLAQLSNQLRQRPGIGPQVGVDVIPGRFRRSVNLKFFMI